MFIGVSVILAVFSYLAYRHLYSYADRSGGGRSNNNHTTPSSSSTTDSPSQSSALPFAMWPFVSTILRQSQSSLSDSSSVNDAKRRRVLRDSGGAVAQTSGASAVPPPVSCIPPSSPPPLLHLHHHNPHNSCNSHTQQQQQSPDTTPRARPVRPSASLIPEISLHDSDEENDDDDVPPSFPSLHSAQRASSGRPGVNGSGGLAMMMMPPPRLPPAQNHRGHSLSMPPPPIPNRNPKMQSPALWSRPISSSTTPARNRLQVVGAGASGVAAGSGLTQPRRNNAGSSTMLTTTPSSSRSRKKIILEPGHSPLDWARLQKSGLDLRGLPHGRLLKVPLSLLAQHKTAPEDIWMALNGKVYNISQYIPFHPGGEKELLRGAGKDGTKLFNSTHPWVNIEGMLEECLIGILVSEEEARGESTLDQVD